MRIVELILDEAQSMMGIEAISIVENPAIEENFLALKSDEIKLAEGVFSFQSMSQDSKPSSHSYGKEESSVVVAKEYVEDLKGVQDNSRKLFLIITMQHSKQSKNIKQQPWLSSWKR